MDEEMTYEQIQDKVLLMEQFALGLLDRYNEQSADSEQTREQVMILSRKIQEFADSNKEIEELLKEIIAGGLSGGEGAVGTVGAVNEEEVRLIIAKYMENIDFTKLFKGHTSQIFKEVERRYFQKYPPQKDKSKSIAKVVATSIGGTLLLLLGLWGVFENVKEKPYYELIIPDGGKVMWMEPGEAQPRLVPVKGGMIVPLAVYKNGKYIFYAYDSAGLPVKDTQGKPRAYYVYENMVGVGKTSVIKLGVADE